MIKLWESRIPNFGARCVAPGVYALPTQLVTPCFKEVKTCIHIYISYTYTYMYISISTLYLCLYPYLHLYLKTSPRRVNTELFLIPHPAGPTLYSGILGHYVLALWRSNLAHRPCTNSKPTLYQPQTHLISTLTPAYGNP